MSNSPKAVAFTRTRLNRNSPHFMDYYKCQTMVWQNHLCTSKPKSWKEKLSNMSTLEMGPDSLLQVKTHPLREGQHFLLAASVLHQRHLLQKNNDENSAKFIPCPWGFSCEIYPCVYMCIHKHMQKWKENNGSIDFLSECLSSQLWSLYSQ